MPKPASIAVQAQPPTHFPYILTKLLKRSSSFTRAFPVSFNSLAKIFNLQESVFATVGFTADR